MYLETCATSLFARPNLNDLQIDWLSFDYGLRPRLAVKPSPSRRYPDFVSRDSCYVAWREAPDRSLEREGRAKSFGEASPTLSRIEPHHDWICHPARQPDLADHTRDCVSALAQCRLEVVILVSSGCVRPSSHQDIF